MWKLMLHHDQGIVWLLAGSAALAYAIGARRPAPAPWRHLAFAAGLFSTWLVTASPLCDWSEKLFSLHMVQHLGLILICAPLLAVARVSIIFPRATARIFRWLSQRPPPALSKLSRAFSNPTLVWLAFCGLFVFWHLPRPYAWALRDEAGHALEHGCFFVSALAFWSVVMAHRSRAPGDGARLAFVGTAALLSSLPGALISLSTRPLYPDHAAGAASFGLTPLEDQQLAGFIMWAPMSLVYLTAMLALLARWLRDGEARAWRTTAWTSLLIACLSATIAGCDDTMGANARRLPTGGDPREGARLISAVGCGACHTIPGVNGAVGLVGPPLDQIGRRIYIAGVLRNTPANLEAWLQDPQKFVPGVVMPNLGLTSDQSRDIAAYLSTLR
jgi:putative membrane protein